MPGAAGRPHREGPRPHRTLFAGDRGRRLRLRRRQGPVDPATRKYTPADIKTETRITLENLKAILEAAGSSLDRVAKVNVYLRDIKDFAAMNEVYATYFPSSPPVRTTIQAAALPLGIGIEIDCIARR